MEDGVTDFSLLGSKHKMMRYFPKDDLVIATVYAPITFPPSNVLVFKHNKEGRNHDCESSKTL